MVLSSGGSDYLVSRPLLHEHVVSMPRGAAVVYPKDAAQIVAMADIYDALRAERCYKPAFDHEKACGIILDGDERLDPVGHFDPQLLTVFAEHHGEMAAIWDRSTA